MTHEETPIRGRPRSFDADEALERAMQVFWRYGYEGASLQELTDAMGIARNSMYRAFGSKEELFAKALERYDRGPAAYGRRALLEPTALRVATAFLHGAAEATTQPGCPPGCLGVQGALAVGTQDLHAQRLLSTWRNDARQMLENRFRQALDDGDLPGGSDPARLARYVLSVAFGIAVQAASGASRAELQEVADLALGNFPTRRDASPDDREAG
ncbi:TetR/AcrR family transcriptional regulator [Catenuloplanes sp. NPDC051500]|uniref:TetR/AcrR family transcriptional regulator n=1 Tax=Catenuloplanes sp. NPDC051500 TaxID=3363959 RepID=UPI0037B4CCED